VGRYATGRRQRTRPETPPKKGGCLTDEMGILILVLWVPKALSAADRLEMLISVLLLRGCGAKNAFEGGVVRTPHTPNPMSDLYRGRTWVAGIR